MVISNKKLLTDLHYGNTNKSTIVNFNQLLAHPKYKKHIEPALIKILDLNSSDEVLLLDFDNRKKIIQEINKFNFIQIPQKFNSEKESSNFFNNADCLSIKENLIELTNDFFGTNLTKSTNNEQDYVVNHFNLTSKLGLFKYNKTQKSMNSLDQEAIIFNGEGKSKIAIPRLKIEIITDKLKEFINNKYQEINQKRLLA